MSDSTSEINTLPSSPTKESYKGMHTLDDSRGMLLSGDKLVFSPPLYAQRYQAVQKIITDSTLPVNKVVDIGSSELKFFRNLQRINGVQDVVLLDIDMETLQSNKYRVQPLMADFLLRRQEPLRVRVVCGDARLYDPILSGAQVITLIEVIEHLKESDLPALVRCVFNEVKPHLVVVTTPNADFNKFFPNHTPGTFRHWDHKFEWTNQQFKEWCFGVVEEYQDYQVEFFGCGIGPDGTFCTQIAAFWHHTQYQQQQQPHSSPLSTPADSITEERLQERLSQSTYKTVAEFEFPVDRRTEEEWKMDYALNRFTSLRNFLSRGESCEEINSSWSLLPWQVDPQQGVMFPPYSGNETHHYLSSLCNFHSGGGTQNINDSIPPPPASQDDVQQNTSGHGTTSFPPYSTPVVHYLTTPHYTSEHLIYSAKEMNNEYYFYVIDNRYAVIPMRSLAQWVNTGEETDVVLPDELISKAVENECFETEGKGRSWIGKVRLYQDTSSLSEQECEGEEEQSYKMSPSHEQSDITIKMQSDIMECWD